MLRLWLKREKTFRINSKEFLSHPCYLKKKNPSLLYSLKINPLCCWMKLQRVLSIAFFMEENVTIDVRSINSNSIHLNFIFRVLIISLVSFFSLKPYKIACTFPGNMMSWKILTNNGYLLEFQFYSIVFATSYFFVVHQVTN